MWKGTGCFENSPVFLSTSIRYRTHHFLFAVVEVEGKDANASQKESKDDVIGRTFNTPLRASAAANLAQKDKSAHKSTEMNFLTQKSVSVDTSSRASSVPGEAQDMSKGYVYTLYTSTVDLHAGPLCSNPAQSLVRFVWGGLDVMRQLGSFPYVGVGISTMLCCNSTAILS